MWFRNDWYTYFKNKLTINAIIASPPCFNKIDLSLDGSFTVELKYFHSMPWYKAIFLSNFFNFI
ncbi:hypothetical protein, partial [Enterococcus cecorum]|uniref:hypothetical protein n=1 Tax=Enterococcus cecorum TaxID=44008 RepID=UPI002ACA270A